jgi:3-oxoacyl-(acyl-carrier-protein) synthase
LFLVLQDGSSRRVVVTGMGLVSPLGHEVGHTCQLLAGHKEADCGTLNEALMITNDLQSKHQTRSSMARNVTGRLQCCVELGTDTTGQLRELSLLQLWQTSAVRTSLAAKLVGRQQFGQQPKKTQGVSGCAAAHTCQPAVPA